MQYGRRRRDGMQGGAKGKPSQRGETICFKEVSNLRAQSRSLLYLEKRRLRANVALAKKTTRRKREERYNYLAKCARRQVRELKDPARETPCFCRVILQEAT